MAGEGRRFGELLRAHRARAGLTQEQLAERAGLSARGLSDLERGLKARPQFETVRLLAGALGLDEAERAELLAGLACVDYVILFDEPTAESLVELIRPDVYVKGADYATKPIPEAEIVRRYGGRVELVPLEAGRSTSGLIEEIARRFGPGA